MLPAGDAPPPAPCFYYSDPSKANVFESTECCVGPWSPVLQHAGPPGALLVRCLEAKGKDLGVPFLARITTQLFRPIPIVPVRVEVSIIRAGKKVTHLQGSLFAAEDEGKELMRATACLMQQVPLKECPEAPESELRKRSPMAAKGPANGGPAGLPQTEFEVGDFGYGQALEARSASYEVMGGCSDLWFRSRVPLVLPKGSPVAAPTGPAVKDEVKTMMSPTELLMLVADSVGGMSYFVDPADTVFLNADMTLNVLRPPQSPWLCMSSRTDVNAKNGNGLASAILYDTEGASALCSASLLMESRAASHL